MTSTPKDPHAKREAAKYERPIASRELIIETLKTIGRPQSASKIAKQLDVAEDQFEALQRRLFAMQREGQLSKNDKSQFLVTDVSTLIEGRILAHRDGFGFLQASDPSQTDGADIYLNNREMRKVFDGDIAYAAITTRSKQGKLEGEIVQVKERNTQQVVGKYLIGERNARVIPDNPKYQHAVIIDHANTLQAEHEEVVVVEITRHPDSYRNPKGIIKEILGAPTEPGIEIEVALRSYDIPHIWPEAVEQETAQLSDEPDAKDIAKRIDLRQLPFVTIDGEDARDFDDAVYCEKKKSGGWRLWVAIADVSHYVRPQTALDQEAINRATSVYFPEKVIPMLPEAISNGLCSLKPKVDRLCMVCEMTVSASGNLSGYHFYESVMHSHARLTYTEVGKMLAEKGDPSSLVRQSYQDLLKPIDELHKLYQTLIQRRAERGAINFETTETRFIFNEQRKIESIVPIVRNDAHKLIEECMLLANVATARFLSKHKIPALYRVHQGPNEKKLGNLQSFLSEKGLSLHGGDEPTPSDYQALLADIQDRDDLTTIQTMLLRSMSQAAYQTENEGHFGLAFPAYTHFTSPIRRYPDLLVHRAIRSIIYSDAENTNIKRGDKTPQTGGQNVYPYPLEALVNFGEHCSMAERRADDATRDVSAYLKCEYLSHHLGDEFEGIISAVTGFGLFVELKDIYVEGLIHISNLDGEYYHFDQAKQRLIGENSRQVYQLGDSVNVCVSKVEIDDRRIHLELTQHQRSSKAKPHSNAQATVRKRKATSGKAYTLSDNDKPATANKTRSKKKSTKKKQGSSKHQAKLERSSKSPKKARKRKPSKKPRR